MLKNKINILAWAILASSMTVFGCNSNEPAPVAQPLVQIPQVPVAPAPVVAVPSPPPATPLLPIGTGDDQKPAPATGGKGGGGSIDKPLPGAAISTDEILGNYSCKVDSKALQIGPFKAPPFGCKIFKAGEETKVSSTSDGAGSMKGTVQDSTVAGFFITGKYEVSGNSLAIKARMALKGPGKYVGKGRGRFNDDKTSQMDYTLTMTKQ